MNKIIVRNVHAVLSAHIPNKSFILVDGDLIKEISETGNDLVSNTVLDGEGLTIFPGFIDVHVHGAVGVDVNTADVDGLLAIAEFLAKNGVTGWVPTLVPDADENYRKAINAIDRLIEIQVERPVAQALGVHYEGVFANQKMCGALRPEFFKKFTGGAISQLPRLKKGVHMTTLAPEIDGGINLVRELTAHGWIVSIGHTRADTGTLEAAYDAGARHLTHFYNAMTGLHHRNVGVVGWALTKADVTFDIIADGIHVDPKMLEFACRSKTPDMVSLISDSVAPTGLGDGDYDLWGETVSVVGGKTQNGRGSIAGSVITMHDAVKRMLSIGFSAAEVSKMASFNPAKLLGVQKACGSIEIGKRADLLATDPAGNIKFVMIGGKTAFEA